MYKSIVTILLLSLASNSVFAHQYNSCKGSWVFAVDPRCGVESYNECNTKLGPEKLNCGHYVGYLGELDRYGGTYSEKVVSWFKNNRGANAYARDENVDYRVVNFGTGMMGSARVFEADIDCYRVVYSYQRHPQCGVEKYRACGFWVEDEADPVCNSYYRK